jgi:hypothetical protein
MKWSELDELVMDAALIATEQEGINPAILQRDLGIQYNRAGRLVDQLETLKIVTLFDETEPRRTLFSNVEAVRAYLNELRSLDEFTEADIDRYNYMRSVNHWKVRADPWAWTQMFDSSPTGREDKDQSLIEKKSDSANLIHPQIAFMRSSKQKALYYSWWPGLICIEFIWAIFSFKFYLPDNRYFSPWIRAISSLAGYLALAIIWLIYWNKHRQSPKELYWVGDHFEAVFPDGKLDPKPNLHGVEFSEGKFKREDWLTLVPANGYFGANGRQLVKIHQAWKNAQKKE